MQFRGLAAIWNVHPVWSGVVLVVVMPVTVSTIALTQRNFSWRNPALYLGDPALGVAAALGGNTLRHMAPNWQRALTNGWLQIGLLVAGWLLGAMAERLGRWQADQRWKQVGAWRFIGLAYRWSDRYHFVMFGVVAAVIAMGMIAVLCDAWLKATPSAVIVASAFMVFFLFWCFAAWKTGQMMKTPAGASTVRPTALA